MAMVWKDKDGRYRCPFCWSIIYPVTDFKDELSRKEFRISGLCQKCQDEMFAPYPKDAP